MEHMLNTNQKSSNSYRKDFKKIEKYYDVNKTISEMLTNITEEKNMEIDKMTILIKKLENNLKNNNDAIDKINKEIEINRKKKEKMKMQLKNIYLEKLRNRDPMFILLVNYYFSNSNSIIEFIEIFYKINEDIKYEYVCNIIDEESLNYLKKYYKLTEELKQKNKYILKSRKQNINFNPSNKIFEIKKELETMKLNRDFQFDYNSSFEMNNSEKRKSLKNSEYIKNVINQMNQIQKNEIDRIITKYKYKNKEKLMIHLCGVFGKSHSQKILKENFKINYKTLSENSFESSDSNKFINPLKKEMKTTLLKKKNSIRLPIHKQFLTTSNLVKKKNNSSLEINYNYNTMFNYIDSNEKIDHKNKNYFLD